MHRAQRHLFQSVSYDEGCEIIGRKIRFPCAGVDTKSIRETLHLTPSYSYSHSDFTSYCLHIPHKVVDAENAYQVSPRLCELQTPSCPGKHSMPILSLISSATRLSLDVVLVRNEGSIVITLPAKTHRTVRHRRFHLLRAKTRR